MSESRKQGRIKWFKEDKGFGFIEVADGADIFLHHTQLSFSVAPGDRVSFLLKDGKKGPVATDVEKVTSTD